MTTETTAHDDAAPSGEGDAAPAARKAPFWKRKKPREDLPKRGFWRGNLEAFTVAIVMALVIKTYAFEAFQVPTESMEPTIIGRTPGGDRIIVNKFRYHFTDPQRYDIVVFRYPLSRMVNYVKRLVGLPGERLRIAHGDIYTDPDGGDAFKIARKSAELADSIFRENPVIPEDKIEEIQGSWVREWFHVPSRVRIPSGEGAINVDAGAAELVLATRPDKLVPERRDRYAHDRQGKGDMAQKKPVSDLRVDLTVIPGSGSGSVIIAIEDGTQPGQTIRLELAVEGSGGTSVLKHGKHVVGSNDDASGGELSSIKLAAGEEVDIRLENCDDRIRVEVDGEEVCRFEYVQHWVSPPGPSQSQVKFGLTGGKASFTHVGLYRDIYYTHYEPTRQVFDIPEGHYLFCGDNSPNSLDARGWRVVGIRLRDSGKVLLGDMEAVSDSFAWPRRDNNPYFAVETDSGPGGRKIPTALKDPSTHHFFDIYGNEWDLESGSYDILNLGAFGVDQGSPEILKLHGSTLSDPEPQKIGIDRVTTEILKAETGGVHPKPHAFKPFSLLMHFVSRDDIMGQANVVFWPPSRWGAIR